MIKRNTLYNCYRLNQLNKLIAQTLFIALHTQTLAYFSNYEHKVACKLFLK